MQNTQAESESKMAQQEKMIEYEGKILSLKEWAKQRKMHDGTLRTRLRRGWSVNDALNISVGSHRPHVQQLRKIDDPFYSLWWSIKQRCYNMNANTYYNYGGRGIRMSETWRRSFERFRDEILRSIGSRPGPEYSLDRINNDGHYQQGNVRWATQTEQMENVTHNKWITHNGETLTLREWSRRKNMNSGTLSHRLQQGWSVEDALEVPVQSNRVGRKSFIYHPYN